MEDRLNAVTTAQQRLFLMRIKRLIVLRDIHCEAKVALISRRDRCCNRMSQRPAQSEGSLVRVGCRLIPALRLRMILLLIGGPYRFGHSLERQDTHVFSLRPLENLRSKPSLREQHPIHREQHRRSEEHTSELQSRK